MSQKEEIEKKFPCILNWVKLRYDISKQKLWVEQRNFKTLNEHVR